MLGMRAMPQGSSHPSWTMLILSLRRASAGDHSKRSRRLASAARSFAGRAADPERTGRACGMIFRLPAIIQNY
jgi:hypothetical protein